MRAASSLGSEGKTLPMIDLLVFAALAVIVIVGLLVVANAFE